MGRYSAPTAPSKNPANNNNDAVSVEKEKEEIMPKAAPVVEEIVDDFDDITEPDLPVEAEENEENEAEKVEKPPAVLPQSFVDLVESAKYDEMGVVNPDDLLKVQLAYRALDRAEKRLARNYVDTQMNLAITQAEDLAKARVYLTIVNEMGNAPKVARQPKITDPAEAFVRLIATLDLARALVKIPDNLDEADIRARASEMFDKGAEEISKGGEIETVWVKKANSLAQPKKSAATDTNSAEKGTRTRHSVGAHIAEAFASAEPGAFMSIDDLVNFKSVEYGDDRPSVQAIKAHLTSKKFLQASRLAPATDSTGREGITVL